MASYSAPSSTRPRQVSNAGRYVPDGYPMPAQQTSAGFQPQSQQSFQSYRPQPLTLGRERDPYGQPPPQSHSHQVDADGYMLQPAERRERRYSQGSTTSQPSHNMHRSRRSSTQSHYSRCDDGDDERRHRRHGHKEHRRRSHDDAAMRAPKRRDSQRPTLGGTLFAIVDGIRTAVAKPHK